MAKRSQCSRCFRFFPKSAVNTHIAGCRSYCGRSTYESWAVSLWLESEPSSTDYWRSIAKACKRESERNGDDDRAARALLAERLRAEHENGANDVLTERASVYSDLLTAALARIDWTDVAEHLLES